MQDSDKNLLHLRTAKVQRLRASLKLQDYNAARDFIGWGSEDFRRIMEAIDFTTPLGEHLDSFAIDIEATAIGSIGARNASMIKLSRRVRAAVDPDYALGAIVPDQRSSTIWPAPSPADRRR